MDPNAYITDLAPSIMKLVITDRPKIILTKAITSLNTNNSMYAGFLGNYQINIAAIQIKLEEFEEAKKIYENILSADTYNGTYNNEIYHNLGIISLREKKFGEALSFFKKVNYSNSKKNIELLYNIGMSWSGLNNSDSTNLYLSKALEENSKWFGNGKSISNGLIVKYKAGIADKNKDYKSALRYYQQALIQFDNNFNETDSSKNPEEFSNVYSYINLFNTLAAKADVFENIYGHEKKIIHLLNALSTYKTAFKLADFVEKTYDSDEARLFLGKIKYTVHSRPIDISLHLYELTKDKKYMEAAWNFDQRNKASLLSLNLQENEWKEKLSNSNELLQQEASIKKSITRTLLKIQNNADSTQLPELYNYNRDKEIELGKIQDKINASPEMKSISQLKRVPGISALQQQLDGSSAIISYHLSDAKILIFCLTAGSINYAHTVLNEEVINNIIQFRTALQNTNAGEKYQGADAAKYLFQQLLNPVIAHLPGITNLIIIPDDELHYLPFDALQDENDQYLLENFSIQYLYSASLFQKSNKSINYSSILGFAPFASKGKNDSNGIDLKRLTYSKEEIEQQIGKLFFDASASKKNFLDYSNKYAVIHLATHAAVNNIEPNRSYIAFYPDSSDYLLYAPEIYNLDLDSTQLVILSACETGTGQLVKGEGLMSLSRAFSYAGCSNIIASLWKAEDKTTSFITKQLYRYLNKGYSKTKALQKAKLDLLNDKAISPSLKSPNYWSHLVFIGDYEANTKSTIPIWLIMSACLFIAGILLILQRKNRKTQK